MSSDRETTRIVRWWLDEGATTLPDRVLDQVLEQLPATPQRRPWWPAWRQHLMNNTLKVAMAAGVVLLAVVIGVGLYFGGGSAPIGPGVAPTASPAASPKASPDDAATGNPGATPRELRSGDERPVNGETLRLADFPFRATVETPAGWSAFSEAPSAALIGTDFSGAGGEPAPYLGFFTVTNIYGDPCRWSEVGVLDPPVGPSVDELANALASMEGAAVSAPTDVTVDGYAGKLLTITAPDSLEQCDPGHSGTPANQARYRLMRVPAGWAHFMGAGQVHRIYIVDVDGERAVFVTSQHPETDPDELAELEKMVDSIDLEPIQ